MSQEKAARIRELNDRFRKSLPAGEGRLLVTAGVSAEGPAFVARALAAVAGFDAFDQDNDPWREHDFGAVTIDARKLFWKINYLDRCGEFGSEEPSDADATLRVLTIMRAEEY